MAEHEFHIVPRILIGKEKFPQLFGGMERVMIVTDRFMQESGRISYVTDVLEQQKIRWEVFGEVQPDPDVMTVSRGIAQMIKFHPEAVVALGGGSPIDAAKAMVYFASQDGKMPRCSLIAVPTTSGTGSEVTNFAVISNPEKAAKYPLIHEELYPDAAVLDAELVKTAPPQVTAAAGMDVLAHGIEAFVSTGANYFTDACAQKAVSLTHCFLLRAFREPEDMEARGGMHAAACLAGIAFGNAGLGLVHGMAHTLGGHFHIPHGKANAVLLPWVMEFNAGCHDSQLTKTAERYAELADLLGLEGTGVRQKVYALIRWIRCSNVQMGIPADIRGLEIDRQEFADALDEMVSAALEDSCTAANPRTCSAEEIRRVFWQAWGERRAEIKSEVFSRHTVMPFA